MGCQNSTRMITLKKNHSSNVELMDPCFFLEITFVDNQFTHDYFLFVNYTFIKLITSCSPDRDITNKKRRIKS